MKLDDLHKKDYFKAPENYFEDFPLRMQKRLEQETQSRKPRAWWVLHYPAVRWSLGFAALVFLAILLTLTQQVQEAPSAENLLASVEQEALVDYLDENMEFTYFDLLDQVPEEALETMEWEEEDTPLLEGLSPEEAEALSEELEFYDI